MRSTAPSTAAATRHTRSLRVLFSIVLAATMAAAGRPALASQPASGTGSHGTAAVLLVCNGSTTPCPPTTGPPFATVQAAVDAAKPGDWILIWPGVYHESDPEWSAGVDVATRDVHIRGMNRNTVIIDGSNGTAAHPCPSSPALQNTTGRNGIDIVASGVSVENLTVCDYLGDNGSNGNEIWWNGGDGSGRIGMGSYRGAYLSATAMFHPAFVKGTSPVSPFFAQYGIFVSNASGPGVITHSYASNMADAAYYVGACQRECDTVLSHDVGVNSSLGYSGTNSGGRLIIKDSLFRGNRAGVVPNSLNNDDAPPPQDGRCPHSSRSCMLIEHNTIVGNNNPNVPLFGYTAAIGAGVELSGGMYDTIRGNLIKNDGSWGVITHDYPDTEKPPSHSHCQGGIPNVKFIGGKACDFPARGSLIYRNTFVHDGFFGNASNGDLATIGLLRKSPNPRNCFYDNRARMRGKRVALTSSPAHIERSSVDGRACGRPGTWSDSALFAQLACVGLGVCFAHYHYPQQTRLTIVALPRLTTMPQPCSGLPANAFCKQ
jgi:hypothetical protein